MSRSLAAALVALAAAAPAAHADAAPRARVAVADGNTGRLAVHDLRSGARVARVDLAEPPYSVSVAPDGRHLLVVEQQAGRLSVLDGGRVAFTVRGQKPAHVVGHGNHVALFDDGTGQASIFDIRKLSATTPVRTISTPRAHHGVAVPVDKRTLITVPAPGTEALPVGVSLRGPDVAELQTFGPCPGLHGEFTDDDGAAFGCTDGVLLIGTGDRPASAKVRYPAGSGPDDHVDTLHGRHGGRQLLGDFGERALLVIDRRTRKTRTVRFTLPVEDFTVDPHSGRAFALTIDGRLHRVDLTRARAGRAVRVVAPFRVPEDWRQPRPELAVGAGEVLIADPAEHRVVRRKAQSLRPLPAIQTGGAPFHMAVVGKR